ncbi:hypothetical protein FRC12_008090 [Ceratobasidium sp. 428]|nr:hypothetical protein FRC12_008090 [Ceratobasidium sp. 428]
MPRQADKKIKGKQEFKSAAEMKKRAKEVTAEVEAEQNESSEVDEGGIRRSHGLHMARYARPLPLYLPLRTFRIRTSTTKN